MKILKPLLIFGTLTLPFTGNAQWNRHKEKKDDDNTVYYNLERNEPAKSGLFGLVVNPVSIDGSSLNLNLSAGLEFFYTFNSHLRISGGYHTAYLENVTEENKAPYGDWNAYGTALTTNKSKRYGIMVIPTIVSWEKEANYHITLGSAGYRTVAVTRVKGKVLKSLTGRLGYQVDNRLIHNNSGLPFKTTTPEYVYTYLGEKHTLTPGNLATSSTRMKSDIAVIGIGYTTFRDVKISLDNDAHYSGRREERAQVDFFIDLLYAHKLDLQDMLYYHSLDNATDEGRHLAQRLNLSATPLTKTGVRLGYQVLSMYRPHFGTKILLEAGLKPGIKTETKDSNLYGQFTIGFLFGGRIAMGKE